MTVIRGWPGFAVRVADASSAAEETMRRRVSELETDKATSDQRHAGVMKRAADEARHA